MTTPKPDWVRRDIDGVPSDLCPQHAPALLDFARETIDASVSIDIHADIHAALAALTRTKEAD